LKKSVAVSLLTLVTALGAGWVAGPAQAAGPGAQGSSVQLRANTAAAAGPAVALRLEPLGDSITYGSRSSTGNGYRGPLWNELTAEGYPLDFVGPVLEGTMADSSNEGHPGWQINALQGIVGGSLATYQPNVVTLMAGTNDLIQNDDVADAPARLSALIDQITAGDPGVTVLVANLIVSTNANVVADRAAFNAALPGIIQSKQAAGEHVALVDMSALTTADLVSDGIHPDDTGYQLMADAWNKGVQAAAAAGWITAPASMGAPTGGASGEVSAGIAGKCLDVNGGNSADGTAVQLWTCNHTAAQTWTVYTDDTLRALGKCLDATGGGTADGTTAQLYTCNGTGAQLWQPYNGGYLNLASGKCLDDPASSATDGTQLELWDCNGGANQQWAAAGLGPVLSGLAGKCLDDLAGSNIDGTQADLWDCNSSAAQQWVVRGGTLQASGLCLDVNGGGTADGTIVQLWDCNGTGGQNWQAGPNGSLVNPQSGKCLDDPGINTANGTQLDIWDCNGGANQQWILPTT
jgi:lysophospholipase L1-like esterase